MSTFTVISQTSRMGLAPLTASPLCAIPGRVEVYGRGVHVAYPVQAADADAAMDAVRDAVRMLGGIPEQHDVWTPSANRWTVIGLADNGSCPSWNTVCVVAGEHEVCGGFDSMLSHRWVQVVDAPDAQAADLAGYQAAAERYDEAWH